MSSAAPALRTQSFQLFRVNILIYAVRLVTGALTARALGVTEMGIFIVLTMLPSYAEAFGRLKFDVAAVYFLGQGKYRLSQMCFVLNVLAIAFSSVLVIGLALFEPAIKRTIFAGSVVDSRLYYLILLVVPLHFVGMNYAYLLLHLDQVPEYNRQNLIKSVVPGLLGLALIYILGWKAGALVTAMVFGTGAAMVYAGVALHREHPMEPTLNFAMIRDLVRFGTPMYLGGILEYLNQYLSGLVVAVYMSPSAVTFFRMGQDRIQVLDYLPGSVNAALYPRLSKSAHPENAARLTTQACRVMLTLLIAGGMVGALLAWPLVFVLYGREFLPMVLSIWLLLPGMILGGATTPLLQYLLGTGRPKVSLWVSMVAVILQLSLATMLIPALGYTGAAVAMSIALLLQSVLRVWIFVRLARVRVAAVVLPRGEDVRLVVDFTTEKLAQAWRSLVPAAVA